MKKSVGGDDEGGFSVNTGLHSSCAYQRAVLRMFGPLSTFYIKNQTYPLVPVRVQSATDIYTYHASETAAHETLAPRSPYLWRVPYCGRTCRYRTLLEERRRTLSRLGTDSAFAAQCSDRSVDHYMGYSTTRQILLRVIYSRQTQSSTSGPGSEAYASPSPFSLRL